MKLWIARTEADIPEDVWERITYYHPEDKWIYTKLYVLYDKPSDKTLEDVRKMCEVPNYMFPEIKEGECVEFESHNFSITSRTEQKEQTKQKLVDKLIKEFSFNANRYKEYADKELKEIGETQNQARLGGLADGYSRALEYVQKITEN